MWYGCYACGCGYVCVMVLLLMSMASAMMVFFSVLYGFGPIHYAFGMGLHMLRQLPMLLLFCLLYFWFLYFVSYLPNAQAQDHRTSSYGLYWIQHQNDPSIDGSNILIITQPFLCIY